MQALSPSEAQKTIEVMLLDFLGLLSATGNCGVFVHVSFVSVFVFFCALKSLCRRVQELSSRGKRSRAEQQPIGSQTLSSQASASQQLAVGSLNPISNWAGCSSDGLLACGENWQELNGLADSRLARQAQLWRVMQTSHNALSSDRKITQREVYYLHAGSGVFRSQTDSNSALQLLSNLSGIPRISLGFVTSARGVFCGCVGYVYKETAESDTLPESADFVTAGRRAVAVPSDYLSRELKLGTSHLPEEQRPAFVLVVEKECIFQRLAEDGFFKSHPCILVTAKGMPDIATRAFVWRLHTELRLPVLGLSDWNPYGLGIMLAYKAGSESRGCEGNAFNVPLRWLGLHFAHAQRFDVPSAAWQSLTQRDVSRARGLLEHPTVQWHESYGDELHAMLQEEGKLELESLLANGLQYMAQTYLPQRLEDDDAE